jgi:hypothetical protein
MKDFFYQVVITPWRVNQDFEFSCAESRWTFTIRNGASKLPSAHLQMRTGPILIPLHSMYPVPTTARARSSGAVVAIFIQCSPFSRFARQGI